MSVRHSTLRACGAAELARREASREVRNPPRVLHIMIWLVVGLAACEDDGPKRFSTGVDGSKPLGTVSGPEAQSICDATQTWTSQAIAQAKQQQLACRVSSTVIAGVGSGFGGGGGMVGSDEELRMACQAAYDRCAMTPPPAMTAAPTCQGFPPGCTATVSEYETCLNDIPPFVDQTLAMLPTCETLNRISILLVLNIVNTLPPSCKTFQMKCGGVSIGGLPRPGAPTGP
jgi:hypothetical protein